MLYTLPSQRQPETAHQQAHPEHGAAGAAIMERVRGMCSGLKHLIGRVMAPSRRKPEDVSVRVAPKAVPVRLFTDESPSVQPAFPRPSLHSNRVPQSAVVAGVSAKGFDRLSEGRGLPIDCRVDLTREGIDGLGVLEYRFDAERLQAEVADRKGLTITLPRRGAAQDQARSKRLREYAIDEALREMDEEMLEDDGSNDRDAEFEDEEAESGRLALV